MRFLIFLVFIFYINPSYSATDDWTSYGKGSGGGHFSKADEITPENVKKLEIVWVHRSGDYKGGANSAGLKGAAFPASSFWPRASPFSPPRAGARRRSRPY